MIDGINLDDDVVDAVHVDDDDVGIPNMGGTNIPLIHNAF